MDVDGGYTLTPAQDAAWHKRYPKQYAEYVDGELYDPITRVLLEAPDWMTDGDPLNGPFDLQYHQSHGGTGW